MRRLAVLMSLILCGSSVLGAANFVIIYKDGPTGITASDFQALVDLREHYDYDHEASRPWVVTVAALSAVVANNPPGADSTRVKRWLRMMKDACADGPLFVMLVGDANDPYAPNQSELDHLAMRYIHDPTIGGDDVGWSEYVSTDDLYCDLPTDGDNTLNVATFRLPAHNSADVRAYVAKDISLYWNQAYGAAEREVEERLQSPPPGIGDYPELAELWCEWAEACDAYSGVGRDGGNPLTGSSYLGYMSVFAEDYDREGRSGALVHEHASQICDKWLTGTWNPILVGDSQPFDYAAREALMDAYDNWGQQVRIDIGTYSNRSNDVNFRNIINEPEWDVDHLQDNYCYPLQIGVSCDINDIDMDEIFGRPIVERTLLLATKGPFAVIAPTRIAREWSHFYFGEDIAERIVAATPVDGVGTTVGRVFLATKNAMMTEHAEHIHEWRSFIGLGDPTARVVPPPRVTVGVVDQEIGEILISCQNPATNPATVRVQLPRPCHVELSVFDVTGRIVARVVDQDLTAGTHSFSWSGTVSAVHFVRLDAGGKRLVKRVVLVK